MSIALKNKSYHHHYDQEPREMMLVVLAVVVLRMALILCTYPARQKYSVGVCEAQTWSVGVELEPLLPYDGHALAPMDHLKALTKTTLNL